jgi:hypothetical protein
MATGRKQPQRGGIGARGVVAAAVALWGVGCGGGGGGGGEAGNPPSPFDQARIDVVQLSGDCTDKTWDCLYAGGVFIDNEAEVTIFWHERAPSAQPGWHVATHLPGGTRMRSRAYVSADIGADLQPLALGPRRFAAVQRDKPNWTSALVDLSDPSAPTVSARVPTPITGHADLMNSMDGTLAVETYLPGGSFSLGGAATALGIKAEVPPGYELPGWRAFAPASGVTPSVWWAFNSALTQAPREWNVYLARVALEDGSATSVRRVGGQTRLVNAQLDCTNRGEDFVHIREYGSHAQVAVGWGSVNAADTGCDAVVDGEVLNDSTAKVLAGPLMAGNAAGLLVVWSENDLGDAPAPGRRIVWRHLDASTGQWTAPARLSSQPIVRLQARATGPGGTLAIAWQGCESEWVGSCTEYVSKYVGGHWSTAQYLASGKTVGWPLLAINANGQAVVAWSDLYDARCDDSPRRICPRTSAYRL